MLAIEKGVDLLPTMKIRVPSDTLFNVIGGESVLLSLKSERYFGLDAVGTKMWTVLTTAPSLEAAQQTLIQEYDVDPQRLRQDLYALVEKLLEEGLVETAST